MIDLDYEKYDVNPKFINFVDEKQENILKNVCPWDDNLVEIMKNIQHIDEKTANNEMANIIFMEAISTIKRMVIGKILQEITDVNRTIQENVKIPIKEFDNIRKQIILDDCNCIIASPYMVALIERCFDTTLESIDTSFHVGLTHVANVDDIKVYRDTLSQGDYILRFTWTGTPLIKVNIGNLQEKNAITFSYNFVEDLNPYFCKYNIE